MPNSNAIVGLVDRIDDGGLMPASGGMEMESVPTVHFRPEPGHLPASPSDGTIARLDSGAPGYAVHRHVLETLSRLEHPAYVEVSRETGNISQVLLPIAARVLEITDEPGGDLGIRLDMSAARHVIKASAPENEEAINLLRQSCGKDDVLVITDTPDAHEIFDVRIAPPDVAGAIPVVGVQKIPRRPVKTISIVSSERAPDLFGEMQAQSCVLPTPVRRCIPFLYPDNGCWARADRMCQLMNEQGIIAGKLWVFGDLKVDTPNHPKCRVPWNFHVAPVVRVGDERRAKLRVIDPAICDRPVSTKTWLAAMGNEIETTMITDTKVFLQVSPGQWREKRDSSETDRHLEFYREDLLTRANHQAQPPPYDSCST